MLKIESTYSSEQEIDDEKLLRATHLFKEVDIRLEPFSEDSCDLVIYLIEKETINFNFSFGHINKRDVYHFGVSERSLFNRNILAAFYSSYERDKLSYTIWSEIPRIVSDVDLLFQFYKHKQNEYILGKAQVNDYEIMRLGIKTGLRYHFSHFLSHEIQIELFQEEYQKVNSQIDLSLPSNANKMKKSLSNKTVYQDLNYDSYRIDGYKINNQFRLYGEDGFTNPFSVWHIELNKYKSFKRLMFAGRVLTGRSSETEYLYPFSIDGLSTVRSGTKNEIRGQEINLMNLEIRYVFYDQTWFFLQSVIFYDFAYLRTNNNTSFDLTARESSSLYAAGPGIRIGFKNFYNAIFRIDLPYRNNKFLLNIGFGQFF
jgi:hypothetical protein